MRLILVDSECELVRSNFLVDVSEYDSSLEHLCKVAASLLELDEVEPEHFEFGSYRPYRDLAGYFVFTVDENLPRISPTALSEVIGKYNCIGYVRRAPGRHADLKSKGEPSGRPCVQLSRDDTGPSRIF